MLDSLFTTQNAEYELLKTSDVFHLRTWRDLAVFALNGAAVVAVAAAMAAAAQLVAGA